MTAITYQQPTTTASNMNPMMNEVTLNVATDGWDWYALKLFGAEPARYTYVDESEYEQIKSYKWRLDRGGYALASVNGKKTYLHRLLMVDCLKAGEVVDHANGDPLDNRIFNLRPCSNAENCRNARLRLDSTTGFKGVDFNKGKFRAKIKKNGRRTHIGYFSTAEEAARAYDVAAHRLHRVYSKTNF